MREERSRARDGFFFIPGSLPVSESDEVFVRGGSWVGVWGPHPGRMDGLDDGRGLGAHIGDVGLTLPKGDAGSGFFSFFCGLCGVRLFGPGRKLGWRSGLVVVGCSSVEGLRLNCRL
jgi:hypothetical protein